MKQHGRIIKNNCDRIFFDTFIMRLKQIKELTLKSHKPATKEILQERYSFACDYEHISIVYETASKNLIITAQDHILNLLTMELNQIERNLKVEKKEIVTQHADKKPISKDGQSIKANQVARQQTQVNKTKEEKSVQKPQAQKPKKSRAKTQADKKLEAQKKLDELYKNGLKIKKFQLENFENLLKKIRRIKSVSCRQTTSGDDSKTYLIRDNKNKVYMRYIPSQNTLQLQGKRSKLFGELQVLISQNSDFETAVTSHIDLTGEEKRARDLERSLKKLLPNTFDFLSEQSKIDITIGMMDIANDDVKLSDYSMLLVPPYRGLERLIFDLQRAKNIEVKMIGQAYEKEDGSYVLKYGYRRKIKSVVYAEVMSALYMEYYAKRNFYAHSDITGDELSRVITEKSTVKEIFDNFVEILEYNIFKLKEIGFKKDASGQITDGSNKTKN